MTVSVHTGFKGRTDDVKPLYLPPNEEEGDLFPTFSLIKKNVALFVLGVALSCWPTCVSLTSVLC